MKMIPLRKRDGTVRDYALVSDEDFERLDADRWYLGGTGYATRTASRGDGRRGEIYMHREVLDLPRFPGRGKGLQGNHLNFNTLDNRRENLEAVLPAENLQHSWDRRKTETCRACGASEWVARGNSRRCAACHRAKQMERNRAAGIQPRALVAACKRGHAYTEENTYVNPRGYRECRECKRTRARGAA